MKEMNVSRAFHILGIGILVATAAVGGAVEDAELAARYEELVEQISGIPAARELHLIAAGKHHTKVRARLRSEVAATDEELGQARRSATLWCGYLEAGLKMSVPPAVIVPQTKIPITIDGDLSDAAWANAPTVAIAYPLDQPDRPADPPFAHCRLLWGQAHLYFGFDVRDRNVMAPKLERDGRIYRFDCAEIFLMPDPRFGVYWELNIAPSGGVLDAWSFKYPNKGGRAAFLEDSLTGLRHAGRIDGSNNAAGDVDGGYTIEVAVPLAALPGGHLEIASGARIAALLAVSERDVPETEGKNTYFANSAMVWTLHNPWAWGSLVLE